MRNNFSPPSLFVGTIVVVGWVMALIFICLPLFGVSLALLKLSNLFLWLGYRLRDGLEAMSEIA